MRYITNKDYISTAALHDPNYIAHHGIKGQKWGVRRFQNPDGSLTPEGEKRYQKDIENLKKAQSKVSTNPSEQAQKLQQLRVMRNRAARRADTSRLDKMRAEGFQREIIKIRKDMKAADSAYKKIQKRYGDVGISRLSSDDIARGQEIRKMYEQELRQMWLDRLGPN